MSSPQQIVNSFQQALNLSGSPNAVSTSPTQSFLSQYVPSKPAKALKPFKTGDIKILLLENVNQTAINIFKTKVTKLNFINHHYPKMNY